MDMESFNGKAATNTLEIITMMKGKATEQSNGLTEVLIKATG